MEVGMIVWAFLFVFVGVYAVNHNPWLFCVTFAFFLQKNAMCRIQVFRLIENIFWLIST